MKLKELVTFLRKNNGHLKLELLHLTINNVNGANNTLSDVNQKTDLSMMQSYADMVGQNDLVVLVVPKQDQTHPM